VRMRKKLGKQSMMSVSPVMSISTVKIWRRGRREDLPVSAFGAGPGLRLGRRRRQRREREETRQVPAVTAAPRGGAPPAPLPP